jgi:undecaprenyl-diphosphatase
MKSWLQQKQNWKIVICVAFFVGFIFFSVFKTNFQSIDVTVNLWAATIQTDTTTTLLAKGLHYIFDTMIIAIITIVTAGFLLIKGHKIQSLLLIAAVGGNALFVTAIKTITQVARPENQLLNDNSFAYPSGHCANAIIFIGLLTYYIWLKWGNKQHVKLLSVTLFSLITAIVSFDRIYLNMHWLSDITGSCLLGAFWLSFCIIFYEQLKLKNSTTEQAYSSFDKQTKI